MLSNIALGMAVTAFCLMLQVFQLLVAIRYSVQNESLI